MSTLRKRPIWWLAGLLLTVTFVVVLAPRALGGATSYIIVSGSSMSPTLSDGDLVVVRQGDYAVGQIVAFETGRGLVIHRIVGGSAEEGFIMQGDNKSSSDSWRPTDDDIVGKHFVHIPEAGRWAQKVIGSPALLGAATGGLASLMVWSPRRLRKRRGAHAADRPLRRSQRTSRVSSLRGAGTTLLILTMLALLLGGAGAYLMMRPLHRIETLERTLYEHTGRYGYEASVDPSIVYDSETIGPAPRESEDTAIYTRLLNDLRVVFDYELKSPPPEGVSGTLSAELRIGTGENFWTRTVPLLPAQEFEGSVASAWFTVDVDSVRAMVARAEEQTGFSPGSYQLAVVTRVNLDDDDEGAFEAELPMELNETLLSISNAVAMSEPVTESVEAPVANDLDILGVSVPVRWARATIGTAFVMLLLAGGVYAIGVRRRLGRGPVARIRLRYGPLIVPVTRHEPNGSLPVEVASIADLVRLARRAEQMVFYAQRPGGEHWFFVPDGAVTYQHTIGVSK